MYWRKAPVRKSSEEIEFVSTKKKNNHECFRLCQLLSPFPHIRIPKKLLAV
jgi:hypothetical protein